MKCLLELAPAEDMEAGWLSDLERGHLIRMAEVAIAADERDDTDPDEQRVYGPRRGPGPGEIRRAMREPTPEQSEPEGDDL